MTDRRVQKTKKAIREAYLSLILEKETPKITITEIAQRADIDRKTFYLHYDSIEDIIHEFGRQETEALILHLEQNDFFDDTADMAALFRALNALIEANLELYQHIARTPSYAFLWGQIKDILKVSLTETMGERLDIPRAQLEICAEFYASGTISTYLAWLRGDLPMSDDQLAEIVGDIAYYGLHKLISPPKAEGDEG
ncbi:TetR/AcrR family transcriptional regulator [Anaerovorax odorimutans]|uniref:TetR/AcrR family transcriptional regulator n=1 Tax=Anaerovorax odorimutans TaxID=109327 RepID=A0ABT1RRB4_9FIRM|nr:TetR/AcrR family transcriptional regulator [Anaerovorax odorimutans]MCQ4637738.1 TetR/AcrR family transcriptional regulator [Anaerovorax odorimutans]